MSNQTIKTKTDLNLTGAISCDNHFVLLVDATSKIVTISLPDSSGILDICIIVFKTDTTANVVRVQCSVAGQKINGESFIDLSIKGDSMQLFAIGNGYAACRSREVSRFS